MNVMRNAVMTMIMMVLFGWGMIALYDTQTQFSKVVATNGEPPWEITFSLTPILAVIIIGGVLSVIMYKQKRKTQNNWKQALLLPPEIEEGDEREKFITGKACRNSYIAMWYGFPIVTALMLIYPFVSNSMPYFPILVILLLPFIQMCTYVISIKKNY